jgi:hypothetical protein
MKTALSSQQCFEGTASLDKVVHRLMHYQLAMDGAEEDWTAAGLLPRSTLIAIEMSKRLDTKLARERASERSCSSGSKAPERQHRFQPGSPKAMPMNSYWQAERSN